MTCGIALVLVACVTSRAAKKAPPTKIEGLVVKAVEGTLLINAADEKHFRAMTVVIDKNTAVVIDGKPAPMSDLKPGQRVIVSPPAGKARQIEAKAPRKMRAADSGLVDAMVVLISAAEVVIRIPTSSGEIGDAKAAVNDKTVVKIDGKQATLKDLAPGQYVSIAFLGGEARRIVVQAAHD